MALSSLDKGAECVPGESLPVGRDGPPAKKALSENKRRLVLSLAGTSWAGGLWMGVCVSGGWVRGYVSGPWEEPPGARVRGLLGTHGAGRGGQPRVSADTFCPVGPTGVARVRPQALAKASVKVRGPDCPPHQAAAAPHPCRV